MPGCSLVTTGHTSGPGGVWLTAFCAMAVADCALPVATVTALNVPPRNARRFIMSDLVQGPSLQDFSMWPGYRHYVRCGSDSAAPTASLARVCAAGARQ